MWFLRTAEDKTTGDIVTITKIQTKPLKKGRQKKIEEERQIKAEMSIGF